MLMLQQAIKIVSVFLVFIVGLCILGLGYLSVDSSFEKKYWWYEWDSNGNSPHINWFEVWDSWHKCPRIQDDPFVYKYPLNNDNEVNKHQIIVLQAKEGYRVFIKEVSDLQGMNTKLVYYSIVDQRPSGDYSITYPNSQYLINDRIIAYPFGTMLINLLDKLFSYSNEQLKTHREILGHNDWGENNTITMKIAYIPFGEKNSHCKYPYIYKFTTGAN